MPTSPPRTESEASARGWSQAAIRKFFDNPENHALTCKCEACEARWVDYFGEYSRLQFRRFLMALEKPMTDAKDKGEVESNAIGERLLGPTLDRADALMDRVNSLLESLQSGETVVVITAFGVPIEINLKRKS